MLNILVKAIVNEILKRGGKFSPLPKFPKRKTKTVVRAEISNDIADILKHLSITLDVPSIVINGIILELVVQFMDEKEIINEAKRD